MASDDQKKDLLKGTRPVVHSTPPKPWTVPLVMTTVAKILFAELPGRGKNLFKHHRMEASLEIPVGVPSWLLNDFSGMLQCPGGEMLNLTPFPLWRLIVITRSGGPVAPRHL